MTAKRVNIICEKCFSEHVTRDAWAAWDMASQSWFLASVYDHAYCHDCDAETHIDHVAVD